MIAPDVNLLIYAYDASSPFHTASKVWLEELLSSGEPVGVPVLCVHAFARFITNSRIVRKPLSFAAAAAIVDSWLTIDYVRILYPGESHWKILQRLAYEVRLTGPQITDAAIAAIAIEYGATIHSNDRDFARFPGLRWTNPLDI